MHDHTRSAGETLWDQCPAQDPAARFEMGCVYDSTSATSQVSDGICPGVDRQSAHPLMPRPRGRGSYRNRGSHVRGQGSAAGRDPAALVGTTLQDSSLGVGLVITPGRVVFDGHDVQGFDHSSLCCRRKGKRTQCQAGHGQG